MKKLLAACAAGVLMATSTLAHDPRPGPNGGLMVDAGSYHTELVANGSDTVTVFLFDANDQPVASTGFKGNAILVVGGKPARFALEAAEGHKLVGKAPGPVDAGVKGAVQITLPDGTTIQGKF